MQPALTDQQIQDIADRIINALEHLAPAAPSGWSIVASLAPVAVFTAALVAAWVGWRNLKHQQRALTESVKSNARSLSQKSKADARSEWWKRTQWALEAAASKDPRIYAYGAGMLDLLAQSELAGPKDKELLDAVWEGTDTEMQDEDIEQLIKDASEQEDLTYEELKSVVSYDGSFDRLKIPTRKITEEDVEAERRRYEESLGEPPTEPVDDNPAVRDNGHTKEDADD